MNTILDAIGLIIAAIAIVCLFAAMIFILFSLATIAIPISIVIKIAIYVYNKL